MDLQLKLRDAFEAGGFTCNPKDVDDVIKCVRKPTEDRWSEVNFIYTPTDFLMLDCKSKKCHVNTHNRVAFIMLHPQKSENLFMFGDREYLAKKTGQSITNLKLPIINTSYANRPLYVNISPLRKIKNISPYTVEVFMNYSKE